MKQHIYFFYTHSTRAFISAIITLCSSGHTYPVFDAYNAYMSYQAGAIDAAEEQYASLAANNLSDWRPLYNLGTIALNKQNYPDAVTHLEKSLELEPANKTIQERLALAKKLRDAQKQQQQNQNPDSQNQNSQNQHDSQKQESNSGNSNQQEKQKQSEQQSKEREQRSQQADQQKSSNPDQQKGQSNGKEEEKKETHNTNNNHQCGDTHKESEESGQQGQQEREKNNTNNNTEQQRQEPMHAIPRQKETQTTQKKIAQAQTLANDARFSEEEKKFMQQLDLLDKEGQQQMLAIALAPSQAEQQFQNHNW